MAQQIDASTGNIIASYLFDAWGARSVSTSDPTAASDPYSGYGSAAGYITDWETGLQLLGHRYYLRHEVAQMIVTRRLAA